MQIIVTKRERETFKEFKEDICDNLSEMGMPVGKSNPWDDYNGIQVTGNEDSSLIIIDSKFVIDALIMGHRIAGVLISFISSLRGFVGQLRLIDYSFEKNWKKKKEVPNESKN